MASEWLVERMHEQITELQVEVERLHQSYETVHEVVANLKSELTKARELLKTTLDLPFSIAHQRHVELFLAHQSAPAAKGDDGGYTDYEPYTL